MVGNVVCVVCKCQWGFDQVVEWVSDFYLPQQAEVSIMMRMGYETQ